MQLKVKYASNQLMQQWPNKLDPKSMKIIQLVFNESPLL